MFFLDACAIFKYKSDLKFGQFNMPALYGFNSADYATAS